MLSMRELEAQAKALVPVLRDYVKGIFQPLSDRLDEAEEKIKAVKVLSLEEVLAQVDYNAITDRALIELKAFVDSLPLPENGKDADPELVKQLIDEAVAAIPRPENGRDGKNGVAGKSVEPEELRPLIAEELSKAIGELPVPNNGVDGKDGAAGKDGVDGKSVPVEEVRRMVDDAVAKAFSAISAPKNGLDGEPGRDAAELEILPAIDEAKSYARGTYAQHANGLWRAYERTHGMKGWECIVAGVSGIEVTSDDDREFAVKCVLSTGVVEHKTFHMPCMIYRGVFKEGMHHPGDTVTWGGSLWHCDEPTSDKPGEVGSKGWTLAAKRGRDGKDGRNGIDKTAAVKLP